MKKNIVIGLLAATVSAITTLIGTVSALETTLDELAEMVVHQAPIVDTEHLINVRESYPVLKDALSTTIVKEKLKEVKLRQASREVEQ